MSPERSAPAPAAAPRARSSCLGRPASAERGLLWETAPADNKRASPELLAGVKNCLAKG